MDRNRGKPVTAAATKGGAARTFWRLANTISEDCLIWPHGQTGDGYGTIRFRGRKTRIHRAALIYYTGIDRVDLVAAHGRCHNPLCMNARAGHVYWATNRQNSQDTMRDGTWMGGQNHPQTNLADDDVLHIWSLRDQGVTATAVAESLGLTRSIVGGIWRGETWPHLTSGIRLEHVEAS